jgi:beta-glucosidase-like glycosyl hydrolase
MEKAAVKKSPPIFLTHESPWADSVFSTMSMDEKIGQLFMVPAYSNLDEKHVQEVRSLIEDFHVGGLIFMQGGPVRQANLTNEFQELAKTPLMLAMDAEWGLGMRLDSTISYPRQMALGAIRDEQLIYDFGAEVGRQLGRLGVHVNFAPVVDINNNPDNPVIGNRSFGEDKHNVSEKGNAYMKGLQDAGILACAKHFPGHGDTDVDSHKELPVINQSTGRLDSLELFPFNDLISNGLGSMMIAHLYVPSLDSTELKPSTLSEPIVTDLLREQMGFNGLIFTDAMTMQGIAKYFEPGEMDVRALQAGNDVLLFPADVGMAFDKIKIALDSGWLSKRDIEEKCMRILRAKEWCGLHDAEPIDIESLNEDLNGPSAKALHRKLASKSLTVLHNRDDILPLGLGEGQKIVSVTIGTDSDHAFNKRLNKHLNFDTFELPHKPSFSQVQKAETALSEYDLVIVNFLKTSNRASKNYNISEQAMRLANSLAQDSKVIVNLFATPYALHSVPHSDKMGAVVVAYHDDPITQESAADLLCGAETFNGELPVTINDFYTAGSGLSGTYKWRLRHVNPEYLGVSSKDLYRIDSIAQMGIEEQAYPGCRVLAAKDGYVFYDKSFGHYTYEKKEAVSEHSIYDLASITKVVASTASLMKLQDEGLVNVDYNLCDYLDICDTLEYYNMNLREMLSHYARLRAWIPFYTETLNDGQLNERLFREASEPGFTTQVADDLYIMDSYSDSIMNEILGSSLRREQEYKYSDLGYYFVQNIVERESGLSLDRYAKSACYDPLNLSSTVYHPLEYADIELSAPT